MKNLKYRHIILTSLLLCLYQGIAQAQTTPNNNTSKLAARLSVSQDRAMQIQAAYNDHRNKITGLINNKTIGPKEKQKQLKQLLAERQKLINATVNHDQQTQLTNTDTALIARLETERAAIRQRHQEQINRMSHRHVDESQLSSLIKQ